MSRSGTTSVRGYLYQVPPPTHLVYHRCMSRTNIDIDEDACRVVMERYRLSTKRDAVNLALRTLAGEPLSLEKARSLRGSGWEGDLDEMRTSRAG
jgi:Arc/MetJ family transcription regulator